MMARRGLLGLLAGSAAAVLGGCGLLGGSSYRFKMTVEVETPTGVKTGSSVYEVTAKKLVALTSEAAERVMGTRGEALVLDLPDGPVFALMKTPNDAQDVALGKMSMAVLDPEFRNNWVESAGRISGSWSTLRGEVPRDNWPMMVRFRDINDPRSVAQVDPVSIGVKRIVVETTSEDVTVGLETRLRWLRRHVGSLVERPRGVAIGEMPLAQRQTVRAFSTEIGE